MPYALISEHAFGASQPCFFVFGIVFYKGMRVSMIANANRFPKQLDL